MRGQPSHAAGRRVENQQLLLDEDGLGHHGTRTAGTGDPDDSRQQMEKQDGEIAHGPIVTSWPNPGNAKEMGIRHAQVAAEGFMTHDRTPQEFATAGVRECRIATILGGLDGNPGLVA